jgi:hypothetical protein
VPDYHPSSRACPTSHFNEVRLADVLCNRVGDGAVNLLPDCLASACLQVSVSTRWLLMFLTLQLVGKSSEHRGHKPIGQSRGPSNCTEATNTNTIFQACRFSAVGRPPRWPGLLGSSALTRQTSDDRRAKVWVMMESLVLQCRTNAKLD